MKKPSHGQAKSLVPSHLAMSENPTFKPTWSAFSTQALNHRPEQPSRPLQRRRWLRLPWYSQPWTQSRVQPPCSKSPNKLNPSEHGKLSKHGFWSKVGSTLYPAKGQAAQNRQLWALCFLNSSYHGNLRSPEIQRMEGQGLHFSHQCPDLGPVCLVKGSWPFVSGHVTSSCSHLCGKWGY